MNIYVDDFFLNIARKIIANPEYRSMKKYIAHGRYSVYDHCIRVAIYSYSYARNKQLNIDYKSLIIGALLHDYYLYDWHKAHEGHKLHGFRHPFIALAKARKTYKLNPKVCNMIRSHMFPLTFWTIPLSREAWILQMADKKCARLEHKTVKLNRDIAKRKTLSPFSL